MEENIEKCLSTLEQAIRLSLETVESPTAGGAPKDKIPTAPFLGLVDSLVSMGKPSADTASDLKKALIDFGKEVSVEVAKNLIQKYLGPGEKTVTAAAAPGPGVQVYVGNGGGCGCPTRTQPATLPGPEKPPAECPKAISDQPK